MGRQDEDREAARERRRAYYESLSPQEKKEYRERVIRARKIKKLRKMVIQGAAILLLVIVALIGVLAQKGCDKRPSTDSTQGTEKIDTTPGEPAKEGTKKAPEWVIEDWIRVHEDTRPGEDMEAVAGVILHATGLPGVSAESVRSEVDKVDKGEEADPVSHFIIGIDGTVIQCIPLGEISYAAGTDHTDMISILCCHIDDSGKLSKATQEALARLVNWLLEEYHLDPDTVMRHHDVGGADCPDYYVDNLEAWNLLVAEWGGTPVEIPEETPEETVQETEEAASAEEDSQQEEPQ